MVSGLSPRVAGVSALQAQQSCSRLGRNPVLFSAALDCSPSCHSPLRKAFTLCALGEWAAVIAFLDISSLASGLRLGHSDPICQQSLGGRTTVGFHFKSPGKGPSLGCLRNRIARVSAKYPVPSVAPPGSCLYLSGITLPRGTPRRSICLVLSFTLFSGGLPADRHPNINSL